MLNQELIRLRNMFTIMDLDHLQRIAEVEYNLTAEQIQGCDRYELIDLLIEQEYHNASI